MKNKILAILAAIIFILTIVAVTRTEASFDTLHAARYDTMLVSGNGYLIYMKGPATVVWPDVDSVWYCFSTGLTPKDLADRTYYLIYNKMISDVMVSSKFYTPSGTHEIRTSYILVQFEDPFKQKVSTRPAMALKIKTGHSTSNYYDLLGKRYRTGLIRLNGLRVHPR